MKNTDKYKSDIFDSSKLEKSTTYSKNEITEDIKNKKAPMLSKGISLFRSKGLLGFILWTTISFKIFGYKYSTITTNPALSIGFPIPGREITLNPEQSLFLTCLLIFFYLVLWLWFYFDKKNNLST